MKKITEVEWDARFQWSVDEDHESQLLPDNHHVRMLLKRIGLSYVWSQEDGEDGGYEIVPGMSRQAIGYYLCDTPRSPEDPDTVVIIPPTDF